MRRGGVHLAAVRGGEASSDELRLFEHLREQQAPLRLKDFPAHQRSPGLSEEPGLCRTFQGAPMRHRSADVRNFFSLPIAPAIRRKAGTRFVERIVEFWLPVEVVSLSQKYPIFYVFHIFIFILL